MKELCASLLPHFEQKMLPRYTACAWMRYWRRGPEIVSRLQYLAPIARLDGSYSSVMGLPLFETAVLLDEADFDLLGAMA